jgi:hypothetical protein
MNVLSALVLGAGLCVGLVVGRGQKVTPDKENVVASRLEGDWVPDEEIGARLGTKTQETISFKADASVLDHVPSTLLSYLKDKQIYLAGTMTMGKPKDDTSAQALPTVVIESKGNPTLVCFRSRGGKEIDDAESGIVMLATARDKAKDILFMGGDFNNEPMRAWRRKAP